MTYGYSKNVNGFSTVVIGEAVKFTKNGVSLKVIISKRSLWGNESKPLLIGDEIKEIINISGMMLFPVKL
jgi:hypothetical protein